MHALANRWGELGQSHPQVKVEPCRGPPITHSPWRQAWGWTGPIPSGGNGSLVTCLMGLTYLVN
eukprot:12537652-Prorocentrum_lima.AAC.1